VRPGIPAPEVAERAQVGRFTTGGPKCHPLRDRVPDDRAVCVEEATGTEIRCAGESSSRPTSAHGLEPRRTPRALVTGSSSGLGVALNLMPQKAARVGRDSPLHRRRGRSLVDRMEVHPAERFRFRQRPGTRGQI
jgi:hypothetical protein